jgi:hypothetical protein
MLLAEPVRSSRPAQELESRLLLELEQELLPALALPPPLVLQAF